jgi:hypothetical protein
MKNRIPTILLIVTILATLFLSACQPPKPAALSNDQVVVLIQNSLTAIAAGDYQAFTRDFSDNMKSTFTEPQFASLAELLKKASGSFLTCDGSLPEISNSQDYAVYRLMCSYDLEKVIVTVTLKVNGDKIEGLFFDSTNLRKISQ